MCGRFALTLNFQELTEAFHLSAGFDPTPQYNIAPTREVAAVREEDDRRILVRLRWGLIPFWSKEPGTGFPVFNARSETAHARPAFRAAFRGRRCLIPASGFYEWARQEGKKQPYYIHRIDGRPLALAGLWEHWEDREGKQAIESCTILTTASSGPVAGLHDRMPAILEPGDIDVWLDPAEHDVETLRGLLRPAPAGVLTMYPVSTCVNKAGHEGSENIEPVQPGTNP